MASVNRREQRVGERGIFPELLRWLGRVIVSMFLLGWMGLIFYLSSLRPESVPATFSSLGRLREVLVHFGLYAVLGGLSLITLWGWLTSTHRRILWVGAVIIFGGVYGVLDEVHQSFVPGRSPSLFDVFIDSVGIVVGAISIHELTWHRRLPGNFVMRNLRKI